MDETVEIKRNIFGVLTNKSRRALVRQQNEREEQLRKMLAGELPKGKSKEVAPPKKLTYAEMPATSMAGGGSVAARLEIYAYVLKDLDERAKEMKANGGFGVDRLAPTKWRNNKLKWWRAALGLDDKGNPL